MSAPAPTLQILPSVLAADFGNLASHIAASVKDSGVQALHLDVMDGHFVPNISFGVPVVKSIRGITDAFLDTHLMIEHPETYAKAFCDAGADLVTVHCEASGDPAEALKIVKGEGRMTGIAINPETDVEKAAPFFDAADLVLIMSVHPGFGGQSFMPEVLPKFDAAKALAGENKIWEIDGGINAQTTRQAYDAGARWLVAGTAVFGQDDPAQAARDLRARCE